MFQKVLAVASASEVPGPVAGNNLRLRGGFAGDDLWRVILGEGLLAISLNFGRPNRRELTDLIRLNRSRQHLRRRGAPRKKIAIFGSDVTRRKNTIKLRKRIIPDTHSYISNRR